VLGFWPSWLPDPISNALQGGSAMLTIPRKKGESIVIGEDIVLTVVEILGDRLRLQIECPQGTEVHRKEIYDVIVSPSGPGKAGPGSSSFVSR
jgi:carbon storage regulator